MKFVLVLLVALQVTAGVEWQFFRNDAKFMKLRAIEIGTPGQKIEPFLMINDACPGLWIIAGYPILGEFNMSASSTFHKNTTIYSSIVGADNFVIPEQQHLEQKLFNVVTDHDGVCTKDFSFLSFSHSAEVPNYFLESVLDDYREQVIVLTYDSKPGKVPVEFNGTLTIGERPSICDSKWTSVNVSKDQDYAEWTIDVDKVSLGKYAAFQPGPALFNFEYEQFVIPSDVYTNILEILDVYESGEDGIIKCDSDKDIVLTVNGFDLHITPADYVIPSNNGDCYFAGKSSGPVDYYFTIPITILRNECLLFDFKNNQIGFAEKVAGN